MSCTLGIRLPETGEVDQCNEADDDQNGKVAKAIVLDVILRSIIVIIGVVIAATSSTTTCHLVDGVLEAAATHENVLVFWVVITLADDFNFSKLVVGGHLRLALPLDVSTVKASIVALGTGHLGSGAVATDALKLLDRRTPSTASPLVGVQC